MTHNNFKIQNQKKMNYRNLGPTAFHLGFTTEEQACLLDVRTPNEVAAGVIDQPIVIDFLGGTFEQEVAKLDRSKTYYVYCRSGKRSVGACETMAALGFKSLVNLEGGILAWNA